MSPSTLFFNDIFILCALGFCLYVYHVRVSDFGGYTVVSCQVGAEIEPVSLEEQLVFVNAELSLQPPHHHHCYYYYYYCYYYENLELIHSSRVTGQ